MNMKTAYPQDNPQEDQDRTDEHGRRLPQQETEMTAEEAERIRKQGEESAETTQAIKDGRMKPGDDPASAKPKSNPRAFQTGVDKPHGGGTTELEERDRANRLGAAAGGPGPAPNPNNPDDPTNPASTAHRNETVNDGDARRGIDPAKDDGSHG